MLYNIHSKAFLKQRLEAETFSRKTISFYRYVRIENPQVFRDKLYIAWNAMQCLGRIYIAKEGINAQMSVPEHYYKAFIESLNEISELKNVPIKVAIEDDGKSFYKLTIKVRPHIVADGLNPVSYDVTNVGNHLSALEFHALHDDEDTVVVDMRNHYESEIGRFTNAWTPDADTFQEAIRMVEEEFANQKSDKRYLLYCTGGIRCEKASAYLKSKGFKDVNQLHGGIIEYARQIKKHGLSSKFIGKNFVFDNRLGERINHEIISQCHQCGAPCDTHINCANDACHLLFIQCEACKTRYSACCSTDCAEIIKLPEEKKKQVQKQHLLTYSENKIFKSRLRPNLKYAVKSTPFQHEETCR